jgi:hypothetical protein
MTSTMEVSSTTSRSQSSGLLSPARFTRVGRDALMTRQPSGQASILVEFLIRRSQVRILLLHERRELVEVL